MTCPVCQTEMRRSAPPLRVTLAWKFKRVLGRLTNMGPKTMRVTSKPWRCGECKTVVVPIKKEKP